MNNEPAISRKKILLIFLGLVLIWIVTYFFNHSVLIVSSTGNEEKTVYLRRGDDSRDFKLTSGSKIFFLPRGAYEAEVTSGDNLSKYQRKLGGFWINKINIKVLDQKQSLSLGSSESECAADNEAASQVVYYQCVLLSGANPSVTNDGISSTPLALGAPFREEDEVIFQPHKNGYLATSSRDNTLFVKNISSALTSQQPPITITEFDGTVGNDTFTTFKDKADGSFAVLDYRKKSLLVASSSSDDKPDTIDLSGELHNEDSFLVQTFAYQGGVAILNYVSPDEGTGDIEALEDLPAKQKIVFVDLQTKSVSKEQDLSDDIRIREASASSDGTIIFANDRSDQTTDPYIYTVNQEEGITELDIISTEIADYCWKDAGNFYYTSVTENTSSIYLYSLSEQFSSLVYSNINTSVTNLNCVNDQLFFSAFPNDPSGNVLNHYKLLPGAQKGIRLETVLPWYFDLDNKLFAAKAFKNSLNISSIGEASNPNQTAQTKQKLLGDLTSQDIILDGYSLNIIN